MKRWRMKKLKRSSDTFLDVAIITVNINYNCSTLIIHSQLTILEQYNITH